MSLMVALAAIPGILGTQEAIRQGQQKERREEHRARRCNLIARCIKSSVSSQELDGRPLDLRDGAVYVNACGSNDALSGHQLAGYFLPYPDSSYEGLVTTITDAVPMMNWVYIHSETHQLQYGVRKDAEPHFTGPFDCTRQDRRLTVFGWEGFCAVEMQQGVWSVFFDIDDDGLKGMMGKGIIARKTRVLEIELSRVEKRWKKDVSVRTADQSINREKELDLDSKEVINELNCNSHPPARSSVTLGGVPEPTKDVSQTSFGAVNGVQESKPHTVDNASAHASPPTESLRTHSVPEEAKILSPQTSMHAQQSIRRATQRVQQAVQRMQSDYQPCTDPLAPKLKPTSYITSRSRSQPSTESEDILQTHANKRWPHTPASPTIVHAETPVVMPINVPRPRKSEQLVQNFSSPASLDHGSNANSSAESVKDYTAPQIFLAPVSKPPFDGYSSIEEQVESRARVILRRLRRGSIRAAKSNKADLKG